MDHKRTYTLCMKYCLCMSNCGRDKWLAVVKTVMNLQVSYDACNFLTSWGTNSLSTRTVLYGDWDWFSKKLPRF